jgi:hypothetical protein
MIAIRRDVAYTIVIIWAFVGIVVKQSATANVANTAAVLAAAIALFLLVRMFTGRSGRNRLAPRTA